MSEDKFNYGLNGDWPDRYAELYQTRALTINELVNSISVRIYDMAAQWLKTPEWSGQRTLDPYCRIFYVENGSAWVECNHERIDLLPGQFYFFPAWTEMFFPENHDTLLYLLHCRINAFSGIDLWHMLAPHPVTLTDCPSEIREAFKQFATDSPRNIQDQMDLLALTYRLIALFFRAGDFKLPDQPNMMVQRISQVLNILEKEPTKVYRTAELAKCCYMSRSRFCTEFKKVTGMSPAQYQMLRRLFHIQQHLLHSDVKLEALAETFGFSSAYHLSNTFKRYLGVSPSVFRRRRYI